VKVKAEMKTTAGTKGKILYPHNDINGGISNAAFRRFLRQYDAMWINFFKMNLESEPMITLPPHFTTMFNIPVFIYICIIFTIFIFKNFISIFNSVVSDLLDHHFQTFTVGDLSDCKMLCLSLQTASVQAKTLVKAFANPDSI
jgi:hypothetical protein